MESVSVGCDRLDSMLRGGIPTERSLLVTGPPGTGKTTLAMQYLQDGVDADEKCLLVSTEQTVDELRDTFERYPFDVDAPELTVPRESRTVRSPPEPMRRDRRPSMEWSLRSPGVTRLTAVFS